jgi:hypothetical protein
MGKKKAPRAAPSTRKPPKAKAARAKPRPEGGGRRRAAPGADDELLAELLALQERTAAVGRQLRAIGDLIATVMREATVTAAEVIEQVGGAVDAESPQPPPVAARPRRRRPPGTT